MNTCPKKHIIIKRKEGHNSIPQKGDMIVFTWNGLGSYENVGQDK